MKYLKKYEDFKRQEFAVDDIVKLNNGEICKIVKINSKNSYIVHMMKMHAFVPVPVEVRDDPSGSLYIIDLVKSNSTPAIGTDIMQKSQTDPSNDFVINGGYPDTPMANVIS